MKKKRGSEEIEEEDTQARAEDKGSGWSRPGGEAGLMQDWEEGFCLEQRCRWFCHLLGKTGCRW